MQIEKIGDDVMGFYNKDSKSSKVPSVWIYGRALIRSYILTLVLFVICALIVMYTAISANWMDVFSSAILIICTTYISIYVAVHHVRRGWIHGPLVALIYIVLLMLFGRLIISDFVLNRFAIYRIMICIVTGFIGGIIGVNINNSES